MSLHVWLEAITYSMLLWLARSYTFCLDCYLYIILLQENPADFESGQAFFLQVCKYQYSIIKGAKIVKAWRRRTCGGHCTVIALGDSLNVA